MADWASLVIYNNIEKKKKENCKVLSLYISKIIGQSYDFWRQVVAIILSAKQVPNKFLFCLQSHAAASTVRTQRKPNYLNLLLRIFPNAFRILPFHEVSIQFPHVSWLNRWFVFWFTLFSFVNSLTFASNIRLADINSLSWQTFMFRLSGAQVRWQWMTALIPVNTLGVNAWPFSVFTLIGEELSQVFTQVRYTCCFEIYNFFSRIVSRTFSLGLPT